MFAVASRLRTYDKVQTKVIGSLDMLKVISIKRKQIMENP